MLNTHETEFSDDLGNERSRFGNAIVTIVLSRNAINTPAIATSSTVRGATPRRRRSGAEAGVPTTRSRPTLTGSVCARHAGIGQSPAHVELVWGRAACPAVSASEPCRLDDDRARAVRVRRPGPARGGLARAPGREGRADRP